MATLEVFCVSCPTVSSSGILLVVAIALLMVALGGNGATSETPTFDLPASAPPADPTGPGVLAPATAAVDVRDYVFEDEASGTSDTTIALGGTVTWTVSWGDHSITHTLARPLGVRTGLFFDSGYKCSYDCGKGDTFAETFDVAGVHAYYCLVHPEVMRGTVTVIA